jgi:hypothetical protein
VGKTSQLSSSSQSVDEKAGYKYVGLIQSVLRRHGGPERKYRSWVLDITGHKASSTVDGDARAVFTFASVVPRGLSRACHGEPWTLMSAVAILPGLSEGRLQQGGCLP